MSLKIISYKVSTPQILISINTCSTLYGVDVPARGTPWASFPNLASSKGQGGTGVRCTYKCMGGRQQQCIRNQCRGSPLSRYGAGAWRTSHKCLKKQCGSMYQWLGTSSLEFVCTAVILTFPSCTFAV